MNSGGGRSIWWAGLLTPFLVVLSGCVTNRAQIEQAVIAPRPSSSQSLQTASAYRARCPDLLHVDIAGLPQYSGPRRIEVDGRISLGEAGRAQVDGATTPEIVSAVAEVVGVPPEQVHVAVAEHKSQYLYLYGQIAGMQRAVPYQGPETVLDLLRRVGGLRTGAALRDITVIRPHVAEGKTPEVFHVDLAAIVLKNDAETNVLLEPFDQVHVGQSRRAHFSDCLPPWLRPVYDRLCGMKRLHENTNPQSPIPNSKIQNPNPQSQHLKPKFSIPRPSEELEDLFGI